jgi:hypothetical protein
MPLGVDDVMNKNGNTHKNDIIQRKWWNSSAAFFPWNLLTTHTHTSPWAATKNVRRFTGTKQAKRCCRQSCSMWASKTSNSYHQLPMRNPMQLAYDNSLNNWFKFQRQHSLTQPPPTIPVRPLLKEGARSAAHILSLRLLARAVHLGCASIARHL